MVGPLNEGQVFEHGAERRILGVAWGEVSGA